MIVCFDCPVEIKKLLDSLVATGKYQDPSAVIVNALQNLAVLEGRLEKDGLLVLDNAINESRPIVPPLPGNSVVSLTPGMVPRIFRAGDWSAKAFGLPVKPQGAATSAYPPKQWIFGMYNKLLPAKANCRALANIISEASPQGLLAGVDIEKASLRVAKEARTLGRVLSASDRASGFKRDQALATAFPSDKGKVDKSLARYANQFVARLDKNSRLHGLLVDLMLIGLSDDKTPVLQLTTAGWHFAELPNPVLDALQPLPTQRFSDEEIDFLIRHISANVPAEVSAYNTVFAAISEGHNTPELIDSFIRRRFNLRDKNGDDTGYVSTAKSGAISRMADLGLVIRQRDGVRVYYGVTESGKSFVSKPQSTFK